VGPTPTPQWITDNDAVPPGDWDGVVPYFDPLEPADYCTITLSGGVHKFDLGGWGGAGMQCYEYERQSTDVYNRVALRMKVSGVASSEYEAMYLGTCVLPSCDTGWEYGVIDKLEVETDKKLTASTYTGAGYASETSSLALSADTWYDIVVQTCSAASPDGWVTVDVDGARWITITGEGTTTYRPYEQLMIGRINDGTGEDDIYFGTTSWTWLPIGPENPPN